MEEKQEYRRNFNIKLMKCRFVEELCVTLIFEENDREILLSSESKRGVSS